jgi:hypothetical protein
MLVETERPQGISRSVKILVRVIVVVALTVTLGISSFAQTQRFVTENTTKEAASAYRAAEAITADDIIARTIENNRLRDERLRTYSAVRTYEIQNQDGRVAAQAIVREDYRSPGVKTFSKISEKGSIIVRHLVFDRLLQSEEETSSGQAHHDNAISAANYNFTLVGQEDVGDSHCYILEAKPKRLDKYLFEGTLWVDDQEFAIVQISGHPAKKPSFWVKRADFVRQYQRIDGLWLPYRDETTVDVKAYGTKVFSIEHQQYVINATNRTAAASPESDTQN